MVRFSGPYSTKAVSLAVADWLSGPSAFMLTGMKAYFKLEHSIHNAPLLLCKFQTLILSQVSINLGDKMKLWYWQNSFKHSSRVGFEKQKLIPVFLLSCCCFWYQEWPWWIYNRLDFQSVRLISQAVCFLGRMSHWVKMMSFYKSSSSLTTTLSTPSISKHMTLFTFLTRLKTMIMRDFIFFISCQSDPACYSHIGDSQTLSNYMHV